MPDPGPFDAKDEPFFKDIETTLRGVQGSVRGALVQQIKKLVEQNPEVFVRNLRGWLNVGRYDD